MTLPKLGHAVIIKNLTSEMPGSNEDVKALTEAYKTVGFEVQVHENCTAQVCVSTFNIITSTKVFPYI